MNFIKLEKVIKRRGMVQMFFLIMAVYCHLLVVF